MANRHMFVQQILITRSDWDEVKKKRPLYFKGWILLRPLVFERSSSLTWVWARLVNR